MRRTVYHATDRANRDSIETKGLQTDERGFVFVTTNKDDAKRVGDFYDTIDDVVIFECEVMDCHLREDPDPHGDIDSRAHTGGIMPVDLRVVSE
jgi:RNA:NAD 2'-phosphotransferase (TPT1/KptA family)